jgi:elongation factor P
LDAAEISYKNGQYLYNTGDAYTFMEFDTSELFELPNEIVDDVKDYLKENMDVYLMMHE